MNRGAAFAGALLLIALLFLFRAELTGFVGAASVSFTAVQNETGNITAFNFPAFATGGTTIPLNVTFENIGAVAYKATIAVFILDNASAIVFSSTDAQTVLASGQSRTFATSYSTTAEANYTVLTNVSFSIASSVSKNGTMNVSGQAPSPAPTPSVGQESAPSTGAITPPSAAVPKLQLSVTPSFSISPGQSVTLTVLVKNIGNATANATTVSASANGLSISVDPAFLGTLFPGQQKVSVLTVTAPETVPSGNYTISIKAAAGGATATASTTAVVLALPDDTALWNEIDNLRFLIAVLAGELDYAEGIGADVAEAADQLQQARETVDRAARFLEAGDLAATKENILLARGLLVSVARLLAAARGPPITAGAPSILPALLLVALAAAIVLLGWSRRRKKQRRRTRK